MTDVLDHRSGLIGVSGIGNDMRALLASPAPEAAEAVALFAYRVGRELGSLAAALAGTDALVFTAGIGEHAAPVRARVCEDAAWLGVRLDPAANLGHGPRISTADSPVSVWVIPTTQTSQSTRPDVISLAEEEGVNDAVLGAVLGLWDVVNNLTRLRPSRRDRYRVTIFGSARATPGSFGYEETKRAAAMLAAMGCDIVTGGGPGLMQAANEGASTAPERARSIGIRVELPFEQDVNAFVAQAFRHRTFFTRLHQFAIASDAFIVAPGGIGTVLEMVMIWQLLQVRHLQETPLILVGPTWPALIEWARQAMLAFDPPLANAEDLAIPRCVRAPTRPSRSSRPTTPRGSALSRQEVLDECYFEPAARPCVIAADPDATSLLGTCHSASPLGIIGESVAITARLRREKHDLRHATDVDAILHAISIRRDSVENERHHRASRQDQDST